MPTIAAPGPYTLLIEFEVAPAQAQPLIDAISAVVEASFRPDPRFLSASFHVREDGRRMLNYAQWTSRADYAAFMESIRDTADAAIGQAIARCGARPLGGHAYAVRRIVERSSAAA